MIMVNKKYPKIRGDKEYQNSRKYATWGEGCWGITVRGYKYSGGKFLIGKWC